MNKRKGKAKGLLSAAVACAMAITLMPAGAALADDAEQSWVAPSSKSATSYVEDGKTYTYITSSARKVSESTADVLGISNVTVCPTAGNPFTYAGSATDIYNSIKTNARFGIYGSEVNQNMNPYYANYFYNQYTAANNGTDLADTRDTVLVDQRLNPGGPNSALTQIATEYGTSPVLYYRPDILYGVTSLTSKDDTSVKLSYGTATTSISGYSELVEKIRNKELGEYEGLSLYQEGDENYDPYYVMYDMTSYTGSIIDNLYNLANAAEGIMDRTADTDNPKVTRYDDPLQIASDYEAYLRGTQYAVLAAIADKTGPYKDVTRKTIGIVKSVDVPNNAITFMPCNVTGKDTNDYPEFLEAVTDNICDKNGLTDGAGTAKDLLDCDVVYIYGYNGINTASAQEAVKDNLITILKNYGATDEAAYPPINVQAPKTVIHHDRGGSVENTVLLGALIGYAYPEVVNPVHSLAYFYENFYHIRNARLQDALGLNLASMSLPAGVELSLEGYDADAYEDMLARGEAYYLANKATIDATYPKLAATEDMTIHDLPAVDPTRPTVILNQTITASDQTVKFGAKAFNLGATTNGGGALTYTSSNTKVATVDAKGNVTVKGAGTAKITINAAATDAYNAATKDVTVKVNKAANTVKLAKATKTVKVKTLKKKAQTVAIKKASGAKGTVTYKIAKVSKKKAAFKINAKTGKITVKKGTAKGTYKVTVQATAKGNANYDKGTAKAVVTIKVK